MSTANYAAFGLNIRSEIPLPELTPAGDGSDVNIRLGKVSKKSFHKCSEEIIWPAHRSKPFCLSSACGSFLILDGREIIADPIFPPDDRRLGFYVLERVLIALLYQRRISVFHASTININESAVAFMGPPHAGKTAMSSSFCKQGCMIVDDDILAFPMDELFPRVFNGYPMIKLWPDIAGILGVSLNQLHIQFPGQEKRVSTMNNALSSNTLPLRTIYILEENDTAGLEQLKPGEAVKLLISCWYGLLYRELFEMAGGYAQAFKESVYLASTIKVFRLFRPLNLSLLPDLTKMIIEDNRKR